MIITKQAYDYYRQENGKFTVFQVPIFSVTDNGDGREVSVENLRNIVEKMQSEKERGWYARLILGHQSDEDYSENAPGVGFLDNFQLDEESGMLYADLVEIDSETFQLLEDKYPNRSCEYRQSEELIESLALLESRTPYFRYPIFRLGEEKTDISKFTRDAALLRFQAISNDNSRKGGVNPELEETNRKKGNFMASKTKKQALRNKVRSMEKELKAKNEELERLRFQAAQQFMDDSEDDEKEDDEKEEYMSDEPEGEGGEMPEESGESEGSGITKEYMDECMAKVDKCMSYMEKMMAGESSAPHDMNSVAMQSPEKANRYTKNIASDAKRIAVGYSPASKEVRSLTQKYASETEEVQSVARDAATDWEDTVNQKNKRAAQKFLNDHPDKEKFIANAVAQEKASAGSYDSIYRGGRF